MISGLILNDVVIAQEACQVHVLLWRLDDLSEKFLETPMVSQDGEALTKKVSAPFLDCSGNGEQLADIC